MVCRFKRSGIIPKLSILGLGFGSAEWECPRGSRERRQVALSPMEEFCARQRALLDLEKQAEAQQLQEKLAELTGHQCQLEGISLLNLNLVSSHTSLFGKLSLQLANHKHQQLAKSQFKVGDEVVLYNPKHKNTKDHEEVQGIVSKVTTHTIELVHSDDGGHNATSMFDAITNLRLDLTSSEATHKKMLATLDSMQQHKHTDNILTDLLFNNSDQNSFWKHKLITPNATRSALVASDTFNKSLNASQIRAINVSLDSNYVSIIHGPPGTGKTSTVVELIIQTLKGGSGKKLLVCAPSNVAVDNILERLVTFGGAVKPVRMGHPARVSGLLIAFSFFLSYFFSRPFLADLCCFHVQIRSLPTAWIASWRRTTAPR